MREQIIIQLSTVFDPEIPVNVWELGLIYDIRVQSNNDVEIVMTLTAPNCPEAGLLPYQIEQAVKRVPDVGNVDVKITFEPPWNMDKMSEAATWALGFL